jgi:hypothetical protein
MSFFFNLAGEMKKAKQSEETLNSVTFSGTTGQPPGMLASKPMALGNLTKQLATQALNEQVNNVLDAFRPGEPAKPAETVKPAASAKNLGQVIVSELQAMQKALKEEQELVVMVNTGSEFLRVSDIYLPSGQVLVLSGFDAERNVTRVISPANALQLVCKVMKVKPETKPSRVNFIVPKA